ncbi:MAG: hypothetical protein K0U52_06215 [Gammaproteobacteria bacterium]|nr:hypothetical protein [Gammaproteobacteria bacterium]
MASNNGYALNAYPLAQVPNQHPQDKHSAAVMMQMGPATGSFSPEHSNVHNQQFIQRPGVSAGPFMTAFNDHAAAQLGVNCANEKQVAQYGSAVCINPQTMLCGPRTQMGCPPDTIPINLGASPNVGLQG